MFTVRSVSQRGFSIIRSNTNRRTGATTEFEKDFYEHLNNVFGKTMENVRKRVNVLLVYDKKEAKKLVAMPSNPGQFIRKLLHSFICSATL